MFIIFVFNFFWIMKVVKFQKKCVLPDISFSVEQEYIKISDIENGVIPSSPKLEHSDSEKDFDDDFDDQCHQTDELDNNFERDIYEEKSLKDKEFEDVSDRD